MNLAHVEVEKNIKNVVYSKRIIKKWFSNEC